MRKFHGIALIAMAIAVCTASNAQSAAVNQPMRGGTCWTFLGNEASLSNSSQFTCDILGKVTIGQIYEKGYRIVGIFQHPKRVDIVSVVIEEQR